MSGLNLKSKEVRDSGLEEIVGAPTIDEKGQSCVLDHAKDTNGF